MAVKNKI